MIKTKLTINNKPLVEVSRKEALEFCFAHKEQHINFYDYGSSVKEKAIDFDKMIKLLESGEITAEQLPSLGFCDQFFMEPPTRMCSEEACIAYIRSLDKQGFRDLVREANEIFGEDTVLLDGQECAQLEREAKELEGKADAEEIDKERGMRKLNM